MLDIKTLEGWLWEAACKVRGEIDAPKYKDYILPLIFLKRLSDVFDDDVSKLAEECIEWFRSSKRGWLCSFQSICDVFDTMEGSH